MGWPVSACAAIPEIRSPFERGGWFFSAHSLSVRFSLFTSQIGAARGPRRRQLGTTATNQKQTQGSVFACSSVFVFRGLILLCVLCVPCGRKAPWGPRPFTGSPAASPDKAPEAGHSKTIRVYEKSQLFAPASWTAAALRRFSRKLIQTLHDLWQCSSNHNFGRRTVCIWWCPGRPFFAARRVAA